MGSSARIKLYMYDNGPLILDGGLATELEAQGAKLQVKKQTNRQTYNIIQSPAASLNEVSISQCWFLI